MPGTNPPSLSKHQVNHTNDKNNHYIQNQQTQYDNNNNNNNNNNPDTTSHYEKNHETYILSNLRHLYKTKILPIERKYHMYSFLLPTGGEIHDAEFDANPLVLLLGQYSTGKTSFIRYILGDVDFPGMHIGPEPTTDKFMALVHGDPNPVETPTPATAPATAPATQTAQTAQTQTKSATNDPSRINIQNTKSNTSLSCFNTFHTKGRTIQGNSLTVMPKLPFSDLSSFGSAFLNHFQGSICTAPLLKNITIIDTPGILSGQKQRSARSYDFAQIVKWFADRSDLILMLFDSHKLDISDELKQIIHTIQLDNEDKIRCVLNKADTVEKEHFVRVYGSLMWSIGKIFQTPEVIRVYTGSYWEKQMLHSDFQKMFQTDEQLLIHELKSLPQSATERKLNHMVKRIRIVKVHVCILSNIRQRLPYFLGLNSAKLHILNHLDSIFDELKLKYSLSPGDMPNVHLFRDKLKQFNDWYSLPYMDTTLLTELDQLLQIDIPNLMCGPTHISETTIQHNTEKKDSKKDFKRQVEPKTSCENTSKKMRN